MRIELGLTSSIWRSAAGALGSPTISSRSTEVRRRKQTSGEEWLETLPALSVANVRANRVGTNGNSCALVVLVLAW
jgi:hypothetical protein